MLPFYLKRYSYCLFTKMKIHLGILLETGHIEQRPKWTEYFAFYFIMWFSPATCNSLAIQLFLSSIIQFLDIGFDWLLIIFFINYALTSGSDPHGESCCCFWERRNQCLPLWLCRKWVCSNTKANIGTSRLANKWKGKAAPSELCSSLTLDLST